MKVKQNLLNPLFNAACRKIRWLITINLNKLKTLRRLLKYWINAMLTHVWLLFISYSPRVVHCTKFIYRNSKIQHYAVAYVNICADYTLIAHLLANINSWMGSHLWVFSYTSIMAKPFLSLPANRANTIICTVLQTRTHSKYCQQLTLHKAVEMWG